MYVLSNCYRKEKVDIDRMRYWYKYQKYLLSQKVFIKSDRNINREESRYSKLKSKKKAIEALKIYDILKKASLIK